MTQQSGRDAAGHFVKGHGVGATPADEEGVYTVKVCDSCGSVDGVEPLYPLDIAAAVIPFSTTQALRVWLHAHRNEFTTVRIRKYGWTKKRMLTRSEIFRIREILMLPYSHGVGRPPSPSDPLIRVLRGQAISEEKEALQSIIHEAMAPDVPVAQEGHGSAPPVDPQSGDGDTK